MSFEESVPSEPKKDYDFETTSVQGKVYNVELLESSASKLEAQEMPLDQLAEAVAEGHYYWEDREGKKLGPADILKDWEAAQANEAWTDHVKTIKRANLANPIWQDKEGFVFNGMHRLTKAFLDAAPTILVKRFETLPEEAEVKEN